MVLKYGIGYKSYISIFSSEYALLYNDRSVLENHHLYYTFKSLQEVHMLQILE